MAGLSEIHRAGIGGVEQQEGFEEKKEEPFPPSFSFLPSSSFFYSHNIVLTLWSSLFPEPSLGPPWTSDYGTDDPAPRLVKLQHFLHLQLHICLTRTARLLSRNKKKPALTRIYFIPVNALILVNLLLSVVFYCCPRSLCTSTSLYVGISFTPFVTCYAHAHLSRRSLLL